MARNNLSITVNIDAPPEKVFAVLCDIERWPEWTPSMSSVQRMERGSFALGSSARVRQPKLRPTVWQVTQFENARNFTWTTRSPGLRMTAGHSIEPNEAGSRVTLSFELSGLISSVVARLYGSLIERYIITEAQGLKKRCESAAA